MTAFMMTVFSLVSVREMLPTSQMKTVRSSALCRRASFGAMMRIMTDFPRCSVSGALKE